MQRRRQHVLVLPARIPIVDVEERALGRIAGQPRAHAHRAPEIVQMRKERQHVGIDGQRDRVAHGEARAGREIDRQIADAQRHPRHRRRPVGKVERQLGLHRLRLARRTQVQLHDQVGVGVDAPRLSDGRRRRRLTRRPHQVEAVGRLRVARLHAGEAGLAVAAFAFAQDAVAIDVDDGVMDCAPVRLELPRLDPARPRHRRAHHEVAVVVAAAGGERIGGQRDDGVGLAEHPAAGEQRRRGDGVATAERRARLGPAAQGRDLVVAEAPLVGVGDAEGGLPRRHIAARRHARDLRGPARGVVVGRERKRRGAAVVMAGRAARVEDGRHVAGEGRLPLAAGYERQERERSDGARHHRG